MTRRYGDAIEVRSHPGVEGGPDRFWCRGRSYVVRTVLARWVEAGPWWSGMGPPAGGAPAGESPAGTAPVSAAAAVRTTSPLSVVERTVWRVEAVTGRAARAGGPGDTSVHDLVRESAADGRPRWWLARTLD